MKPGTLIGWGLGLVGGYLLLKNMGYDPLSIIGMGPGTPVITNTGTGTNTSAATGTANVNPTSAAATYNQIKTMLINAKIDPSIRMNTDNWNWYYYQVRGVNAPAPESLFPGVDRQMLYSLDEWWAGMTKQGFSGFGLIAHHVNPYANPNGQLFGQNIMPNGIETMRIIKGNG